MNLKQLEESYDPSNTYIRDQHLKNCDLFLMSFLSKYKKEERSHKIKIYGMDLNTYGFVQKIAGIDYKKRKPGILDIDRTEKYPDKDFVNDWYDFLDKNKEKTIYQAMGEFHSKNYKQFNSFSKTHFRIMDHLVFLAFNHRNLKTPFTESNIQSLQNKMVSLNKNNDMDLSEFDDVNSRRVLINNMVFFTSDKFKGKQKLTKTKEGLTLLKYQENNKKLLSSLTDEEFYLQRSCLNLTEVIQCDKWMSSRMLLTLTLASYHPEDPLKNLDDSEWLKFPLDQSIALKAQEIKKIAISFYPIVFTKHLVTSFNSTFKPNELNGVKSNSQKAMMKSLLSCIDSFKNNEMDIPKKLEIHKESFKKFILPFLEPMEIATNLYDLLDKKNESNMFDLSSFLTLFVNHCRPAELIEIPEDAGISLDF